METLVTQIVSIVLCPFMKEAEIKYRITSATHQLVMQYGVRSVSMDDIAGNLGMSKKTLYLYFKDKNEIIDEVINDIILNNEGLCCNNRNEADNAVHEMFMVINMLKEMFTNMNPSVMFELQKYHPKTYKKIAEHKHSYLFNLVKQNLEAGIKEKLYRKDIDVNILARFRIDTMFLPFNIDFQKSAKKNMMECQIQIILNFLYGLVTKKGYELAESYRLQVPEISTKK